MSVRMPPIDANAAGWVRAMLTDLAGEPDACLELMSAVESVREGTLPEWSMGYNAYRVEVYPDAARIIFATDNGCQISLDLLASVVAEHRELFR